MLWIRIRNDFSCLDPDSGGQKDPPQKREEISYFEVLVFSLEGFSRSLDVRHGDLGINLLKFMIKEKCEFFQFAKL